MYKKHVTLKPLKKIKKRKDLDKALTENCLPQFPSLIQLATGDFFILLRRQRMILHHHRNKTLGFSMSTKWYFSRECPITVCTTITSVNFVLNDSIILSFVGNKGNLNRKKLFFFNDFSQQKWKSMEILNEVKEIERGQWGKSFFEESITKIGIWIFNISQKLSFSTKHRINAMVINTL